MDKRIKNIITQLFLIVGLILVTLGIISSERKDLTKRTSTKSPFYYGSSMLSGYKAFAHLIMFQSFKKTTFPRMGIWYLLARGGIYTGLSAYFFYLAKKLKNIAKD